MDNVPNLNSPVSSPSRTYVRVLVGALLLVVLIGVASFYYYTRVRDVDSKLATSGEPLKITSYYWPGFFWIDIADKKGWFKEAGLNVELVDGNTDYYQSVVDLSSGKIDINILTLFDLISFNAQGRDLIMIINTDTAFGSEGAIAKQTIKDVRSLKGKKIGLPMGTYLEYMLYLALERNKLSLEDVVGVSINAESAQKEFATGSYDAVLTWDPYFSDTVKTENGKILFDSSEFQNVSPSGVTVTRALMNERPDDLQALVHVWHETTKFIIENPAEAFDIIAEIYDKPVREVEVFATKDKILTLRQNKISFTYSAGFESLHGVARKMNNFLIERDVVDHQLDSAKFLDPRFIRQLELR